jgi:hypothetical protein
MPRARGRAAPAYSQGPSRCPRPSCSPSAARCPRAGGKAARPAAPARVPLRLDEVDVLSGSPRREPATAIHDRGAGGIATASRCPPPRSSRHGRPPRHRPAAHPSATAGSSRPAAPARPVRRECRKRHRGHAKRAATAGQTSEHWTGLALHRRAR